MVVFVLATIKLYRDGFDDDYFNDAFFIKKPSFMGNINYGLSCLSRVLRCISTIKHYYKNIY